MPVASAPFPHAFDASRRVARYSTSARTASLGRVFELLWRSGLQRRPILDPDVLIATAEKHTGLRGAGDGLWRENLEVLCHALRTDAALNPLGEAIAHGQLAGAVGDRLRLEELWRRHPEIADVPVAPPVIILGQMRSGSTRMQRMLACDDRLAHTRFFESWNPVPATRIRRGWDDRKLRARVGLWIASLLNPDFGHIHPTWVDAPDEETGLFSPSFFGTAFETQWRVPAFARHCEALDTRPIYADLRRCIQTLAWLRGGDTRPWILKSPQLAQDIDSVRTAFPGARFVVLHRSTEAIVASSASLTVNQMQVQSDRVDARWVGREWLRKVDLRAQRMADAAIDDNERVDVTFEEVTADWRAVMARVYDTIGLDFGDALAARVDAMLARTQKLRLDRHRYKLADFGLTPEDFSFSRPKHIIDASADRRELESV